MKTRAKGSSGRLTGRLVIFVWAALLLGAVGVKAAPVKTVVQDTLYRADGNAAKGDITIRWAGFSTSAGEAVAAGQMTVKTDANGGISIPLIPNTGSSPSRSYYRVVIKLDDGTTSEEMWVVPAVATTTVAAIRAKVVPQAVAAQFASKDSVDTALAQVVHLAGTETIQGAKTFVPSPQVPVPSVAGGAANKGYVDQAISGLATVASTGNYNDLLNKPASASLASPGAIGAITPGPVNATVYTVNGAPLASANLSDGTLLARTSTTINGFPISSNVTLSASNLTMGALPNGTTATTQAVNDNSAKLATTQYVASSLAAPGAIGATTPGPVNATAITASNSVAVGAPCPSKYPAGSVCAGVINGKINAVGYGADPTGVTDSGAGILAAVVAATSTAPGGIANVVHFPCGDYSFHELDLSAYANIALEGDPNDQCVRFFYNGAGGVGSFHLKLGAQSQGGVQYIRFTGTTTAYASSVSVMAQNALIVKQIDSMSTWEHLSFAGYFGDAIVLTQSPVNFYMRHFRADIIGGYILNIVSNNTDDGNPAHLYDFTIDNTISGNWAAFKAANPYTTGAVATVSIATPGSGMTNGTYRVAATGTSLAPAYAQIVIAGGAMTSATVLGEGSQYTTAPTFNLANATNMSGSTIGGGLGGTLGTLTATLGTIDGVHNGKGVLFCHGCLGLPIVAEHIRFEHNSPDVNVGNADQGTFYYNDDSSSASMDLGWRNFVEVGYKVGSVTSAHPIVSSAQGRVVVTALGPNSYTAISSIYKNRSTQLEYGSNSEADASYWSFGKNVAKIQGTALEGQIFDVIPPASQAANALPRQFGDWFYRRSDFVPGSNGPIRMVTSPASGRASLSGNTTLTTTAVLAANGSNGNVTGFNPLNATGYQLHVGDSVQILAANGSGGTAYASITCADNVGSGTVCTGLGAQGVVVTPAPGCIASANCPATVTVQWQQAQLGDFGLEATRSATAPTTNPCNNGQYVWNSAAPSNTQPIGWRCQSNAWVTLPNYGAAAIEVAGTPVTPTAGLVNFVAGTNVTLTPSGNQITIAASGSGGGSSPHVASSFCPVTLPSSATAYVYGLGDNSTSCTVAGISAISAPLMPAPGTVSNLTVSCATSGVNSSSGVFTVYDYTAGPSGGLVNTGITITYGGVAAKTVMQDTVHTYNYATGDKLLVQYTTQASETLANCTASFNY